MLANLLVPIVGVLEFGWSIYDIFYLFLAEIGFTGLISILKIFTSMGGLGHFYSGIGAKIGGAMAFSVSYGFIFLLTCGLIYGNLEKGTDLELTIPRGVLIVIFCIHLLNYITGFIMNGKYKVTEPSKVAGEAYAFAASIFLGLLCAFICLQFFASTNTVITLGVILVRASLDLLVHVYHFKTLDAA
jgi:hypothetical protein